MSTTLLSVDVMSDCKFTGKERDSETGNDDFGARYYSNRFGPLAAPTGPLCQLLSSTPTSPTRKPSISIPSAPPPEKTLPVYPGPKPKPRPAPQDPA